MKQMKANRGFLIELDEILIKISSKSAVFDDKKMDEINKLANDAMKILEDIFEDNE